MVSRRENGEAFASLRTPPKLRQHESPMSLMENTFTLLVRWQGILDVGKGVTISVLRCYIAWLIVMALGVKKADVSLSWEN